MKARTFLQAAAYDATRVTVGSNLHQLPLAHQSGGKGLAEVGASRGRGRGGCRQQDGQVPFTRKGESTAKLAGLAHHCKRCLWCCSTGSTRCKRCVTAASQPSSAKCHAHLQLLGPPRRSTGSRPGTPPWPAASGINQERWVLIRSPASQGQLRCCSSACVLQVHPSS